MSQQREYFFLSVIIPEFHLFQVQGELFFGNTMKLNNTLFSKGPEALQAVDVDLARGESFSVVHPQVSVTAEHQGVVAVELIGVDDGTSFNGFDRHIKKTFSSNIPDHIHLNNTVPFQDAKDRDLTGGSPAALALSSASEVAFIYLYFALEKKFSVFGISNNAVSDGIESPQDRRIRKSKLFGRLSGRDIQFKEFDYPQPIFVADIEFVNPPSAEIGEGVFTPFAAVSFTKDSVYFSALTACTKNKAFFPTRFPEKEPRPIFSADKGLKTV